MSPLTTSALAVGLAALGAVLFGLAAVRQHGAVRGEGLGQSAHPDAVSSIGLIAPRAWVGWARDALASGLRLVRRPAWLLGAGQAGLGGALHMVALTLAPITLVQPVGVLAVPVTVVRSAVGQRRRPSRSQVVGSLLSVGGVGALTLVLLQTGSHAAVVPTARTAALVGGSAALTGAVLARAVRPAPAALRCVARAVIAAGLFGLGSVLVRILGQVVTGSSGQSVGLGVTALLGLFMVLPVGVWSMQSAYVVGSPQVVICCLTLVDPVAAVVGGQLLLGDGSGMTVSTLLVALVYGLVAAAGVLLLARDYPVQDPTPSDGDQHPTSGADRSTSSVASLRPSDEAHVLLETDVR